MPLRAVLPFEHHYTVPSAAGVSGRPLAAARPMKVSMPPYRVLIADDDPHIVALLADQLAVMGLEPVGVASNGEDAVRLTESLHPDLVLLDVQMPILDGMAAADQIAARCPVPVLIVTAYIEGLAETVDPARVHGLLGKPWRMAQLERAIPDAVARFRRVRGLNGPRG